MAIAEIHVSPEPTLSILIVTWNSERWIDRCLRSIPAACDGLAHEVVIHDNSKENIGFAAGTNRAFAQSRGRYVLLLNPDCELAPGALRQLYEFLESRPHIAAAVPLLVDERWRAAARVSAAAVSDARFAGGRGVAAG